MQKNKKLVKKQKYRYIRLFTFLGLVAVLSLQAAWIYNTYMLIRNNIQKDCCEVVEKTLENEMVIRMDNLPEGSQVIGGEVNVCCFSEEDAEVKTYLIWGEKYPW